MTYVRKLLAFVTRTAALGVLAGICGPALNPTYAAEMIWAGDFEEGAASIDGTSDADWDTHLYTGGAADVRTTGGMSTCGEPREGNFAGRTRILDSGSGLRVRAELSADNVPSTNKVHFLWDGPEYWLGISVCLTEWPSGSDAHTFLQVHPGNEPVHDVCDYDGNSLSIAPSKDIGTIRVLDNPSGQTTSTGAFSNTKAVYSYNLRNTMGQWQDFVFRFRLSTKGDGYYTVWHNGTKVYSETGLTNVNWKDGCGNVITDKRYQKGPHVGIYGGPNTAGPKTVYLDAVRVAQGLDGYDLVAPRGSEEAHPNPPTGLSVSQVN